MHSRPYIGRFAPSPTGPLHAGSLVAALASWLDARAHDGQWLIRIEDVDTTRTIQGMDTHILHQLATLGMISDQPVIYQSERTAPYEAALEELKAKDLVYPCTCSRKGIAQVSSAAAHDLHIYPRTCRYGDTIKDALVQAPLKAAWRFKTDDEQITWTDRRLGQQAQNVETEVGDFVVKRADHLFAYQMAVVVDDANQGITHIVRGEDLAANTARQIGLQKALGFRALRYLHLPLVLGGNGEKLSKQNGAAALDLSTPLKTLNLAAKHLGLSPLQINRADALLVWIQEWGHLYNRAS